MYTFRLAAFVLAACLAAALSGAQTDPKKPAVPPPQTKKAPATAPATAKKAEPTPPAAADEVIPPAAPDALFPAVVARVNSRAILGRDLEQRIQTQLAPMGNPKWTNLREEFRQELVEQSLGELVGAELIYQKAVASGVKATEAEVAAEFTRFSKTFSSDADLNLALASRGLDRTGLNRELEKSITISKYIQETVVKKIVVTPAELSQYYQQHTEEFRHPDLVRTSHILITVADGATPEQEKLARGRAESVLARAKKGEDFAKLAKEYSTDASASQGGDIGLTPRDQLAPEYEEAAFTLPVGTISNLVRTQFGFHIIKVTEKRKAGLATLEQVNTELTQFLKNQRAQAELGKLVNQLSSSAKIVSYLQTGSVAPTAPTASSPRP
jgi:peptidyl-prolyl cis-trans isomerase C